MTATTPVTLTGLRLVGWATVLLAVPTLAIAIMASGFDRLGLLLLVSPLWFVTGILWLVAVLIYGLSGRAIPLREILFAPGVLTVVAAVTVAVMYLPAYLAPTATMTIRASITGTTVFAHGTTDLPDGALVTVSARHLDMILLDDSAGTSVVEGAFSATLSLDRWPSGDVFVVAAFAVDEQQPREVIDKFGLNGEGLRGPGVVEDSDGYRYLNAGTEVAFVDGLASGDSRALRQPASIVGIVQDPGGLGIVEASVACSPEGTPPTTREESAAGGAFYCVLQPGRYTITARAGGYVTQYMTVDLEPGADRLVNFTLQPER